MHYWKSILIGTIGAGSAIATLTAESAEPDWRAELDALRALVESQQATIGQLQDEVGDLRDQLHARSPSLTISPPSEAEAGQMATEHPSRSSLPQPKPTPRPEGLSFTHHDWAFEVYGYIKLDAAYDTQRTFNGDFARFVYPEIGGADQQLSITARQTRLGLAVSGPEWNGWKPGARIETDFYGDYNGNTPTLRLRRAYAQMEHGGWQILGGQDWDALVVALPKTVNFATYSYQGALWSRRPLVKVTWQGSAGPGKLKLVGALASAISGDVDGGGQPDGKDSGVPNCEATVAYEWPFAEDWTFTAALGGSWGREAFDRTWGGETVYDSYVGMATAILHWKERAKLMGAIWAGENAGSFGGGVGQSVNLAKNRAIGSRGGWVQLQTYLSEKLNWNAAFGLDDPLDADLSPGMRNYNLDASTSIYYQLTSYLTLAAEYSFLQTGYQNAANATSHRVQTSAFVEF